MLLIKVVTFTVILLALIWPTTIIPVNKTSQVNHDDPTAKELLKLLNNRDRVGGDYDMEDDGPARISIYKLNGAYYWTADMSVDCDGIPTVQCNAKTDSTYQSDTSLHTSSGQPLNAAALPYVVIPNPSEKWDYSANSIQLGAVVAVIYKGQVRYGVFGDTGENTHIIGEASYAMVKSFGVNPHPMRGGITKPQVSFIVFTNSQVSPVESHETAVVLGMRLAKKLIQDNE